MEENQKELQKMYLELQLLDEQMKQVQKQVIHHWLEWVSDSLDD